MQHVDHAGDAPPIPREDRRRFRITVSWLHRDNRALPRALSNLPDSLPAIPEVYHQRFRLRGRVWQEIGPGIFMPSIAFHHG